MHKVSGLVSIAVAGAMSWAAPVSAGTTQAQSANADAGSAFARFTPRPAGDPVKLDYQVLDAALDSFVLRMGKSLREGAVTPDAALGSRLSYGHDSRYRLEGNRIGFGYIEPAAIAALSEYRRDLESVGSSIDIAALPRNEQLAYWINLHNVAVIEQIALAYPVSQPSTIQMTGSDLPLDRTPFITVAGVRMSPQDIRTGIVFPNWRDPRIIYAFFRGEIGGPSIQARAFTGTDLDDMLDDGAAEFINSLRGVQKSGDTLRVSRIFAEARPFFFPAWPADLRPHLLAHAKDEVTKIVNGTSAVDASIYDLDIADLSKGRPDPGYNTIYSDGIAQGTRIPADVVRLLAEREQKFEKAVRRGERKGIVTVIDFPIEDETPPKVIE